MSSSTAVGKSKVSESIEESNVIFAAVISKDAHVDSFPCYWLMPTQAVKANDLAGVVTKVLVDPLLESLWLSELPEIERFADQWLKADFKALAVKQFMPGVTDNLAHVVEEAIAMENPPCQIKVASGRVYLSKEGVHKFEGTAYKLYHPVIERLTVLDLSKAKWSEAFPGFPAVHLTKPSDSLPVDLEVGDRELEKISRERLLALTLTEMHAIKSHFGNGQLQKERESLGLPPQPTEVELEIIAQTWSEHCKHKIFNATINFVDRSDKDSPKKKQIKSLYKTYVQKATSDLKAIRKDLLSVFSDNSGVVQWDSKNAVCFKVETHNSPSALEPYGGALTGILGVNRDILGTGIGAKPIFNTDILCFAHPQGKLAQRPKLLPPETIINGVRKGIQDGGNKSGIPTVNGAIVFHDGYRAKPLVFCGTGGILPITVNGKDGYGKHTQIGDSIVMAGGRVGKDGVHGATFSSEALHEGSPVTAVQIGDPFTQKRLTDFVLEARDLGLISGITDNGAGGLSSSVGEMAELTGGASIELDLVPTKYPGLADWEIVVSESQERMTISTDRFKELQRVAEKHHVEISEIGKFSKSGKFEVTRGSKLVASLNLEFLHRGVPVLMLEAEWQPATRLNRVGEQPENFNAILLMLLGHPNISNREIVIRQYDHEVQAGSVIKPLMGPKQSAPCDAAVITPVLGEESGLAVSNGLAPRLSVIDPYAMAVSAVDEAVRNLVCVGADPSTISLLDNFCWPDPVDSPNNKNGKGFLGQLVRTCEGLFDAVKAFAAPLISGKDSMKNDFDDGTVRLSIPPTLLISAMARVPKADQSVSMEFKNAGELIYLIHAGTLALAGSHFEELMGWEAETIPSFDLAHAKSCYDALHQAIRKGYVRSAHDLSDGGLAVALAECIIGGGRGARVVLKEFAGKHAAKPGRSDVNLFAEGPGCILVSIAPGSKQDFEKLFDARAISHLGTVTEEPVLDVRPNSESETPVISLNLNQLEKAWNEHLPFD
jgi:phosphoribosylformylglycinamidine synthase subunit PurSL